MTDPASEQFFSTISELPEVKSTYVNDKTGNESDNQSEGSVECDDDSQTSAILITEPIMLGELTGTQELRIQMKVWIIDQSVCVTILKENFVISAN